MTVGLPGGTAVGLALARWQPGTRGRNALSARSLAKDLTWAGNRIQWLRRAFTNAVARAELPADLVRHDLRHRRVTTWLEEGKPAHKIQKAMGHSDLRTTMMYEHLLESAVDDLVADDYADEAAAG